jgi:uncharacterized membrane protein
MRLREYIGHFHPVLVHLPIGILLVAIFFEWLSHRKGYRKLRRAVKILLLLGFLAALFSSVTGYLLSSSGEYDHDQLATHQWLGISVTMLSFVALIAVRYKEKEIRLAYGVIMFVLAILITLTGHAGGKLTHGEDFLKLPSLSENEANGKALPVDYETALFYQDVVAPVLDRKCKSCHGPTKQKGRLRLDRPEFILEGGKHGTVLMNDTTGESDLVARIHDELSDKDHMPPKEKAQLTRRELVLITWWVLSGADFKSKFITIPKADSIVQVLKVLEDSKNEILIKQVALPDPLLIERLRKSGVVVSFLAQGNGLVSLNFSFGTKANTQDAFSELSKIHDHVIELKASGCQFDHSHWALLSGLTSIENFSADNSSIEDIDLDAVGKLRTLRSLNLVGTKITASGLEKLKGLPEIKKLFLYQTRIQEVDYAKIHALFPMAAINFGNYQVPGLPDDTIILTKPYKTPGN